MSGFWFGKNVSLLGEALTGSGLELRRVELEALEFGHEACRLNDHIYVLFIQKGMIVCQANQDRIFLETGEGIFINRKTAWRLTEGSAGANVFVVMEIRREYLENCFGDSSMEKYVNPVTRSAEFPYLKLEKYVEGQKEMLTALEGAAGAAAAEKAACETEVKGYVYLFWSRLFREFLRLSPALKKAARREKDRLQEILLYIHAHYQEKITLKELAAHCGISSGECCRFFKKHMGQSLFEYLQVYRIQQSMPELLERAGSIGEVSRRHGFNGSSYYAELFKKEMGCAPGDYRKWYHGKGEELCPLKLVFGVAGKTPEQDHKAGEDVLPPEKDQVSRPVRQDSMPAHLL